MSDFTQLKQAIKEIEQRADNNIAFDKANEYEKGLKDIKANYQDTYTDEALQEAIDAYKEDKTQEIIKELAKFDKQSKELTEKVQKDIEAVESNLTTSVDPQSQDELSKHQYVLNKLSNELSLKFTGARPRMAELSEVLNQAKHNKTYANALLQTQNMLLQNIDNNKQIDDALQLTLRNNLGEVMEEIKASILPSEYHELEELKERLTQNRVASTNKQTMYDFMVGQKQIAN